MTTTFRSVTLPLLTRPPRPAPSACTTEGINGASSQPSIPPPFYHLPAPPTTPYLLVHPFTPNSSTRPSDHPTFSLTRLSLHPPCSSLDHHPTRNHAVQSVIHLTPTHSPLTNAFTACPSRRPVHPITLKPTYAARRLESTDKNERQPLPSGSAVCSGANKANRVHIMLSANTVSRRAPRASTAWLNWEDVSICWAQAGPLVPYSRTGAHVLGGWGRPWAGEASGKGWMEVETSRQGQSRTPGPYPRGGRGPCRV